MEAREGISSGVTVIGAEAPSAYHMAPRSEAPSQSLAPEGTLGSAGVGASPVSVGSDGMIMKKKRGRPRKYGPNGALSMALSPLPISTSAPPSNNFSSGKRGKPKGMEYKLNNKVGLNHLGKRSNIMCLTCSLFPLLIVKLIPWFSFFQNSKL